MSSKNLLTYTELGNKNGRVVVLLHGWPDTSLKLYERQIKRLEGKYRIIALNIPGYEPRELRGSLNPSLPFFGYNIREIADMLFNTCAKFCPDLEKNRDNLSALDQSKKPFIIAHDWGCVITNHAMSKYPNFAAKTVLLDVGAQGGALKFMERLGVLAYQLTLVFVFFLPGFIGNPIHRAFAKFLGAPHAGETHNIMAYMYLRLYVSLIMGTQPSMFMRKDKADPFPEFSNTAVLYMYGTRKPFFFHSNRWLKFVQEENKVGGSKVVSYEGGHWFFVKDRHVENVNEEIEKFFQN